MASQQGIYRMRKPELIAAVAEATALSRSQASHVLNTVLDEIMFALERGETVSLPGFGSFARRPRAGRTGRNPQTGEILQIAAGYGVVFKPGKQLKDVVGGG